MLVLWFEENASGERGRSAHWQRGCYNFPHMNTINLSSLYGAASETSPDWAKKMENLSEAEKPRTTRQRRELLKTLQEEHRNEKQAELDRWSEGDRLEVVPELLRPLSELLHKRLKKIRPEEAKITGLPAYTQQGMLSDVYSDKETSYFREYLFQDSFFVPCKVQLQDNAWIDPIVLDFPPIDGDQIDPKCVVLGSDLARVEPSERQMPVEVSHAILLWGQSERGKGDVLVAEVGSKQILLQNEKQEFSPVFFWSEESRANLLTVPSLKSIPASEWNEEKPKNAILHRETSYGLVGLPSLQKVLALIPNWSKA